MLTREMLELQDRADKDGKRLRDTASLPMPTMRDTRFRWLPMFLAFLVAFLAAPTMSSSWAADSEQTAIVKSDVSEALQEPDLPKEEFSLRLIHLTKDELGDLAKTWLSATQQRVLAAAKINIALSSAEGVQREQLQADLEKAMRNRNAMLRKLGLILDEWAAKVGAPEKINEFTQYADAVIRGELKAVRRQDQPDRLS